MTFLRTRTPRSVPAALGVAALLVLTACGPQDAEPAALDVTADDPATSSAPASPVRSTSTETTASQPATSQPAPGTPTPSESSPAGAEQEPELIAYAGGESPGFEVHGRDDAQKMTGAPVAFRQFIGRTAQRIADESTCTDGYVGVTVQTLRTDGYAVGGVNDCGGYLALWAAVDGTWKEVAGSQEMWDCAVLERYTVPSDVAGDACYDYDAQRERRYQQS